MCSNSPLIGKSVRELQFRDQFNAAVVAVARSGERIRAKPGDIVLQRGDILLLDTGAAFARQNKVGGCLWGGSCAGWLALHPFVAP